MSKIRKASLIAPMPDTFAKSALARLGLTARTSGYWSHDIMSFLVQTLPQSIVRKITFQQLRAIRKSALKKKNKDQ
jgi:17beta-estradiol 17-dehydrogenase / very-long-chain 3-oxoacyl-CoA reductase